MRIFSPLRHLINNIQKLCLEVFIPNRKIRRIMKGNCAKRYLKKYINKIPAQSDCSKTEISEIRNYTIWQFWDSGLENAPDIVKSCISSIDKYEPDKRHIILNMDNIKDYVEIPQRYYDLLKLGKMGMAHFSDILRTYLLCEYGGCWIDSTVLLTDKLPEYITSSDLFLFKNYEIDDMDGLNIASYFIHSKPHNNLLEAIKEFLALYWSDNDFLVNYFCFLHMFTLLTNSTPDRRKSFDNIPFTSFIPVQHFQREILKQYNPGRWNQIKKMTPIHKLSYKKHMLPLDKIESISGTYYEKLINGELE